jgi:tetratricopeptide (TPR) repeat protein
MRSQKLMSGYIEQFKNEITAALNYYQKAISYHEENPALHFEYGLILELISEFELALAQYQLATKYNPTNLFYKYRLEKTVRITTGDLYEDRDQLESTYGQTFLDAYMQWNEEHFLKTKPHKIDPHKNPTTRNGILSFLGILN